MAPERTFQNRRSGPEPVPSSCSKWAERLFLVLVRFSALPRQAAATQTIEIFFQRALVTSKWSAVNRLECCDRRLRIYRIVLDESQLDHVRAKKQKANVRANDKPHRRGGSASWAAVVRTVPSMTRASIVGFGSRPEGSRLRGASRYPMSEGSVRRSCLDPPQRSVRTSAADLQSNRPGTDYRVDPL